MNILNFHLRAEGALGICDVTGIVEGNTDFCTWLTVVTGFDGTVATVVTAVVELETVVDPELLTLP